MSNQSVENTPDPNQHVREYLDYFLDLKYAPNYAVLLNGPWGVGKTHFIRHYLSNRFRNDATKALYVSLFGLKNRDEINDALIQAMYPIMGLKVTKLGARIGKAALKHYGIELDIKPSDLLSKIKADVIVFDDLERAEMPLSQAMGYINEFVEHDDCKVILVANAQEFPSDADFDRKREKLIGKTLLIKSSFDSAFESFVALISDGATKLFLKRMQPEVGGIYQQSTLNNFRILLQTMWDFERVFEALTEHQKKNSEGSKAILRLFFAMAFEVKAGHLGVGDLLDRKTGWSMALARASGKTDENFERLQKRYAGINLADTILTNVTLYNILIEGAVDKAAVCADVNASTYFASAETEPSWKTVWHWAERSTVQFYEAFREMRARFSERKIVDIGEIFQIAGLLYYFAEEKALDLDFSEVDADAKGYVDFLRASGKLHAVHDVIARSERFQSYDGLGIHPSKGLSGFIEYLKNVEVKAEEESMPQKARILLSEMVTDPHLFFRRLNLTNDGTDNTYYNVPILHKISPKEFVALALEQPPVNQRTIFLTLSGRFEHGELNDALALERPWLAQVADEMTTVGNNAASIEKYRLGKLIQWYINPGLKAKA